MNLQNSPLRLLAKTFANDLISREQYIEIRGHLLKQLETSGRINESDLRNYTTIIQGSDNPKVEKSYTPSDWIIIGLGLAASAVLAFILYG